MVGEGILVANATCSQVRHSETESKNPCMRAALLEHQGILDMQCGRAFMERMPRNVPGRSCCIEIRRLRRFRAGTRNILRSR